jgi:hypothetical protein
VGTAFFEQPGSATSASRQAERRSTLLR